MLKKALIVTCSIAVLALTGCSNMPFVSSADYEEAVADMEEYKDKYNQLVETNEANEEEIESLNEQIETLEEEKLNLEAELLAAQEELAAIPVVFDWAREVEYEINSDVTLVVQIPEEFSKEEDGTYIGSGTDVSNIAFNKYVDDGSLDISESEFEEQLLQAFEDDGKDVENFEIHSFEKVEYDDYKTLTIDMSCEMSGLNMQMVQYIIMIDGRVGTVTYTTMPLFGWQDEFLQSAQNVRIEME